MSSNVKTKPQGKIATKRPAAGIGPDMSEAVKCEFMFEKCQGGFCIRCCCDENSDCAELQCLCQALCDCQTQRDGNCTCCCVKDGKQICNFNLCCSQCTCEATSDGCRITCTSDDSECCEMLEACCDCLECCCQNGCCCYVCFGNKCGCYGTCAA